MTMKTLSRTSFNGRQFSKYALANWIAFFEHQCVRWKYALEPKDKNGLPLNLGGWQPELILHKKNRQHTICVAQVIDGFDFPETLAESIGNAILKHDPQPAYEPLLLAESPFPMTKDRVGFGWYGHWAGAIGPEDEPIAILNWEKVVFGRWMLVGGKIGFAGEHDRFYDYVHDYRDECSVPIENGCWSYPFGGAKLIPEELEHFWRDSQDLLR